MSISALKREAETRIADYKPSYSQLVKRREGRPTLYEPTYCADVVEHMSKGFSLSSYADYAKVARSTLNVWMEKHEEFSEAVAQGKAARLRFWESLGIEVAQTGGNGSQATMIIFGLKNMGSDEWKEKQEINVNAQLTLAGLVESSLKTIEGKVIEQDQPLSSDSLGLFD